MSALPQLYLPDPLAQWPWLRELNPHYAEIKPESDAWLHGFESLDAKSQNSFDRCNFALLGALAYPFIDKERFRVACDLMALFYIFDEFTDKVDGTGARAFAEVVVDVFRNPQMERPHGESKLGEITRQFWLRAMQISSPSSQERFITSFAEYAYAVIDEASDRAKGSVRGITDYLRLTRLTAGPYPCFFPLEMDLDIPDEVMTHPSMELLRSLVAESLVLGNDLYSYNIEQAAGHGGHNIITVVMVEKGVNLDGALDWVADYHRQILSEFQAQYRVLPCWGPILDLKVKTYVERLACFIRGIDCWAFETERYFGTKGREIQIKRVVNLLPKVEAVTPMMATGKEFNI
ncbi:terpenoid synthase [Multifurca ochricompacta]|uniref:Terpene synthase n=1 Tax=Multifurca ochricompacta TaxID=376703 RepID=A0AAD4M9E0_9AGAM|nr:terpenoid synthase [Multifurca ochricompacta]